MSVDSAGSQANGTSGLAFTSADGRCVAFQSEADDLVHGDTNGHQDVFVHDRQSGATARVSVSSGGVQANGGSVAGPMSADGRCVTFWSLADNLVAGDTNGRNDVFVHDRQSGLTRRASVSSSGGEADAHCSLGSISADGRFVAFLSGATNLVPDDTNGQHDVFVHDLQTGQTTRVSVDSAGNQANGGALDAAISADGRFVAFADSATNLVAPPTTLPAVFVHDRLTGRTTLASKSSQGQQANDSCLGAAVSADGRFVAFHSAATNLASASQFPYLQVYVHDRQSGETVLASVGLADHAATGYSVLASLSAEGRHVAFVSNAIDLVQGDTNGESDVFVRDLQTRSTARISVDSAGNQANGLSEAPSISADGRHVSFPARASNLVPGDTNGLSDVFVRDRGAGIVTGYCTAKVNSQGCASSMTFAGFPSASAATPFTLGATQTINQQLGKVIYGHAPASLPFQGALLCVAPPVVRTPLQGSGGNVGPSDCSGSFAFDMNAHIQSGADPALVPGADVFAQYWSRDPADPFGSHLTDAVSFRIEP